MRAVVNTSTFSVPRNQRVSSAIRLSLWVMRLRSGLILIKLCLRKPDLIRSLLLALLGPHLELWRSRPPSFLNSFLYISLPLLSSNLSIYKTVLADDITIVASVIRNLLPVIWSCTCNAWFLIQWWTHNSAFTDVIKFQLLSKVLILSGSRAWVCTSLILGVWLRSVTLNSTLILYGSLSSEIFSLESLISSRCWHIQLHGCEILKLYLDFPMRLLFNGRVIQLISLFSQIALKSAI